MKKHGKAFNEKAKKIDKEKLYTLEEAISLALETSPVKFDASVEIHVNTGTDPRHADQIVRATVVLPNGTGKTQRIAVFCTSDKAKDAKNAGADLVGDEDLIDLIAKGEINFDVAIADPSMMKSLARVAKVLGPKGLMPSPKSGTVTLDVAKAVEEIKKGKVEFRNDKAGIIHSALGKVSFGAKKIEENTKTFIRALLDAKPDGSKGTYIKKIFLTTAMGPSIQVEIAATLAKA